jgi:probable phosphoglycerate mutase
MTPTIYMIRHGQTDWNAKKRLQGQTEIPMNDLGKSQVLGNAKKLCALSENPGDFDFVSSPICRARETMMIIRETLGLPRDEYRVDDRLKELNYGEFSGHTWDELRQTRPAEALQRYDSSWTYVIPKGECYAMLSKRVLNWFHEIERDTIVAAHAGVSRVLQAHFGKYPDNDVAFLDAPQDRILVLHDNETGWL